MNKDFFNEVKRLLTESRGKKRQLNTHSKNYLNSIGFQVANQLVPMVEELEEEIERYQEESEQFDEELSLAIEEKLLLSVQQSRLRADMQYYKSKCEALEDALQYG